MESVGGMRVWARRIEFTILGLLCGVWGLNQWHIHTLHGELRNLATQKIADVRPHPSPRDPDGGRIAADVVVAKPYIVFGSPSGKISVYVEHTRRGETPIVEGYDYFFIREVDATWTETDSGACASAQCGIDGKRALDARGEAW